MTVSRSASDLAISRGSVQNIVKCELGIRSYRLLQEHTLTDKTKKNMLECAKKLGCHLRAGPLLNVLFTDEIFTAEAAPNSQNHRQLLLPLTGTPESEEFVRGRFPPNQ